MALKLSRAGGVRVSLKVRRAIDKADAARDARDWTHAVDLYRHVLELDPSLAAIWLQYGHMLAAAGEAQGALSAYETAVSRSPSDPDAAFSLAEANWRPATALELWRALSVRSKSAFRSPIVWMRSSTNRC